MSNQYMVEKKQKRNPFNPVIGFIILVIGGGLAWLVSPGVLDFITTQPVSFGAFGQILPINMPAAWSASTERLVIAFLMFLVFFTIFMIIAALFMIKPEKRDPQYVNLGEIRQEREAKQKEKLKRAKRAARKRKRR
ncbi:MAG: hypothetical protein GYB64_03380 [Chloroflexi bacterium]|nr:hypothetical protein [Chloroflexota bacterium]